MNNKTKMCVRVLIMNHCISGAFSGLENFRMALIYDKDIKISRSALFDIMRKDKDFLLETKKIKRTVKRRKMVTQGYRSEWQTDMCTMLQFNSFIDFL